MPVCPRAGSPLSEAVPQKSTAALTGGLVLQGMFVGSAVRDGHPAYEPFQRSISSSCSGPPRMILTAQVAAKQPAVFASTAQTCL